ncbi:hypothetical protein D3C80_825140 [compost metagenome]
MPAGIKTITELILDLLQHRMGLFQHKLADFGQVGARQRALVRVLLQRADHARQGCFDIQQRAGDIHQHRIVWRTLALGQALQHQHLVDDHPPGLAEAEHRQGVGNLPQGRKQRLQVIDTLTVTADKQV